MPIKDIKPFEILLIASVAESKGHNELAHRIIRLCGQIFLYGVACNYVACDCTRDLKGALTKVATAHHPCVKDTCKIGELMRRIAKYEGTFVVQCAFRLTPYLLLRPCELRSLQWCWVDFDRERIEIPAETMKMRTPISCLCQRKSYPY